MYFFSICSINAWPETCQKTFSSGHFGTAFTFFPHSQRTTGIQCLFISNTFHHTNALPVLEMKIYLFCKQGHHHNGNQAARHFHIFCSISHHRFGNWDEASSLFMVSAYCIVSQRVLKCALLTFLSHAVCPKFERGIFDPPILGVKVKVSVIGRFDSSPMCLYELHIDTCGISRPYLCYLAS